jgi:quercetin dioxygenase-like cupin family protein
MMRSAKGTVMKHRNSKLPAVCAVAVALGVATAGAVTAQGAPSVKRNILLKQDMSIPDREAVMATVDLPPGSSEGRHTHPAEVYGFVLEGAISLEVEGKPTATLKAGDVFTIAPGKIHQAINSGSAPAKLAAVFVAEKGKPLTSKAE